MASVQNDAIVATTKMVAPYEYDRASLELCCVCVRLYMILVEKDSATWRSSSFLSTTFPLVSSKKATVITAAAAAAAAAEAAAVGAQF